jgi:hypothetical protein
MMAFDHYVARRYGPGTTELFYDPGISIKNGQPTSSIGGHSDHVHVAVAKPGSHFSGAIPTGNGQSLPAGALSSYAASTGQSATQVFNQLQSGRLTRKQILAKITAAYRSPAASGAPAASTGALSSKYGHPAV